MMGTTQNLGNMPLTVLIVRMAFLFVPINQFSPISYHQLTGDEGVQH